MPNKFYITTAIDYTNASPHLGHAYEKICADVIARFHRLLGEDVFFLTGTDEHGQKVEQSALKLGKTPQEFVDEISQKFKELCIKLNISNDYFIRTTEKKHIDFCKSVFKEVYDNGDIYKGDYEGLYCTGCEAFYSEKELEDGKCKIHKKECETVKEESYFFRLSKYQDKLIEHIEKNPEFILPETRRNEILSRLKQEPLKDLSVSRTSFKWGIPLPIDEKHVIYVWFDALLNYISALSKEQMKKFWPCDMHNVGKDILWFHSVIWPAILFSIGIQPPKTVFVHGFINIGGEKMSKSKGIKIDPIEIAEKYGSDTLRYFLLREIIFGEDGNFSEEALIARHNSELANTLGNLISRVSALLKKNFDDYIPKQHNLEQIDLDFIENFNKFNEIKKHIKNFEIKKAIDTVWSMIDLANKYVNDTASWKIADKERLATVLYNCVEAIRIISLLIAPFIPETSEKIRKQFEFEKEKFDKIGFSGKTAGRITDSGILFKKIELETKEEFPANLKVAEIIDAKQHPDAEKLLILQINLGEEKRQIVAGIRKHYTPEELIGRKIVVVTNLKPAKLRGYESNGMLLAAGLGENVKLLGPKESEIGTKVYFEGIENRKERITIEKFSEIKMTTKHNKVVHNHKTMKTDKEEIFVDIDDGAEIR